MEGLDTLEEYGLVQQQICMAIPGVKTVQQVLPWRSEETTEDGADVTYEQFTDGKVRRVDQYGVPRNYIEKTVIRKTTVKDGVTERYHTLDFWENRTIAKYVAICHPLNEGTGFRMESRLFE